MSFVERLKWFPHNVIGHPLMGICQVIGCDTLANWVHDVTMPKAEEEES